MGSALFISLARPKMVLNSTVCNRCTVRATGLCAIFVQHRAEAGRACPAALHKLRAAALHKNRAQAGRACPAALHKNRAEAGRACPAARCTATANNRQQNHHSDNALDQKSQ